MTYVARESGCKSVDVMQAGAPEAALMDRIDVYPVDKLARLSTQFRD